MITICNRCLNGEAEYQVQSFDNGEPMMDIHVCLACAAEALDLGLEVEPIDSDRKTTYK